MSTTAQTAGAAGDPVGEGARAELERFVVTFEGVDTPLSPEQEQAYERAVAFLDRPASPAPAASAGGSEISEFQQRYAERLHQRATNCGWTALVPGGDAHSPGTQFYWLNLAGIASQEFKALAPAAQVNPGRQEIARSIEPRAWALFHRMIELRTGRGESLDFAKAAAQRQHGKGLERSLAKADAILAARPVAAEQK